MNFQPALADCSSRLRNVRSTNSAEFVLHEEKENRGLTFINNSVLLDTQLFGDVEPILFVQVPGKQAKHIIYVRE